MNTNNNRLYKVIMLVFLTAIVTFMITAFSLYSYFSKTALSIGKSEKIDLSGLLTDSKDNSELEKYLKKLKTTIDKYYLWNEDIDEEKLKTSAIEGYVAGLGDEYTEYIPTEDMKKFTEDIAGNFIGIGIYMLEDKEKNRVLVYYPIPDSPAEKAGIKAGDYIISVDGKEYTAEDFKIISKYIKGEENTKVKLEIEREGERLNFEITREKIVTNPITTKIFEENIGYVKLPSFDENTSKDFKTKLDELIEKGAKSLIIDLRNNGGGIVDEATNIADFMLDKDKTIISTIDNKTNKKITASKIDPIYNIPIVLLVNENSASAAEILICSLTENERAKSVGTKTYGKGVIQSVLTLTDGSGLKITTQEYYTPKDNKINKEGIKPDVEVKLPEDIKNIYAVEENKDTQLQKAIELLK